MTDDRTKDLQTIRSMGLDGSNKQEINAECVGFIEKHCLGDDPENNHALADDALLAVLYALGMTDIVEAFNNVRKWYR